MHTNRRPCSVRIFRALAASASVLLAGCTTPLLLATQLLDPYPKQCAASIRVSEFQRLPAGSEVVVSGGVLPKPLSVRPGIMKYGRPSTEGSYFKTTSACAERQPMKVAVLRDDQTVWSAEVSPAEFSTSEKHGRVFIRLEADTIRMDYFPLTGKTTTSGVAAGERKRWEVSGSAIEVGRVTLPTRDDIWR